MRSLKCLCLTAAFAAVGLGVCAEDLAWKCTAYAETPEVADASFACSVAAYRETHTSLAIEAETVFDSRWEYALVLGGYDFRFRHGGLIILR